MDDGSLEAMESETDVQLPGGPRGRRIALALALLFGIALITTQVAAVFTENINWDEFALFLRVREGLDQGRIDGGGRPGLVSLMMIPFVRGCQDPIHVARMARLGWVAVTLAAFVGLYWLVLTFHRDRRERFGAAALALGALALVPVVLRFSVQVRTDQPALAAGLWGSVLLLASRRRLVLAIPAGLLWAIGYLCTQKLVYIAGLGALLGLADLWVRPAPRWRDGVRLLLCLLAYLAVLTAYRPIISLFFKPPGAPGLAEGLRALDYYRGFFGFRAYKAMLVTLLPHIGLGLLAATATCLALVRRHPARRALLAGWAVAAVGVVVGAVHAAAFPYFWMTLGVFPAVVLGIAWPDLQVMLAPHPLVHRALVPLCVAGMVILGAAAMLDRLRDTQRPQRDSLAFVGREFPPEAAGFNAEGALFCTRPPKSMPIYLTEQIKRRFFSGNGQKEIAWFIGELASRPIRYIVSTFAIQDFPIELRKYLFSHYVPYLSHVAVAGVDLRGPAGQTIVFEVIVSGRYRWRPRHPASATIVVDGNELPPGATVELALGWHRLTRTQAIGAGILAGDFSTEPDPDNGYAPFYSRAALADFGY